MTIQLSVAIRNAMLDAIETVIGPGAVIKMRTGVQPANNAAADSGTVIATITTAADFMAAANAGAKAFSNLPLTDLAADAQGTIAHYRVYAADGTTCGMQGTVTLTGGGGDMTVDNNVVQAGQQFSITSWSINMNGHQ
jgi:hypothetical protein